MARNLVGATGARSVGRGSTIAAGAAAGVIAAIVMGLFAMIVAAGRGVGFWTPMELIGATYFRADWMVYPFWSALLGIGTHLVVGAAWGALYAAITRKVGSVGVAALIGLAYGTGVFLFMTYLIMPWADPYMFNMIDKGLFFLYHLAYGLTLALALPMRERTTTRTVVPTRGAAY